MANLQALQATNPTLLLDKVVEAFDSLRDGVLISGNAGELLFANEAAEQILESGDGLALDEGGRVTTGPVEGVPVHGSNRDFCFMLAAARKRKGLTLCLARPSGKFPLTLTLRPAGLYSFPMTQEEARTVVVLIHDPERPTFAGLSALRELYGLTLTEARLADLLLQGKANEECACLMNIRRTTVKMHLRNLYGKTGVQRQGELLSLMFRSFGNVRCGTEEPARLGSSFLGTNEDIAC